MRKKVLLYIIASILFLAILLFFNRAYRELTSYSALTNRHNTVYGYFQNLSTQINNAAVLNPDLVKVGNAPKEGQLFFTDSLSIIQQLDLLRSTVSDSVNISITGKLDKIIRSELSWLLKSNVPDSIINHKSPEHIASFQSIGSFINQGIQRTSFLIELRKNQLNEEINKIRIWMVVFIMLSGILLFYTTFSLFRQQSKRKKKEQELSQTVQEVTDYKFALDESSIVAITDQKGIINYVNNNFCRISKYTSDELIGQDHRIINSGYHSKEFIKGLWTTIANGKIWKGELKNKAKDGTIYWVDTTIVPFLNDNKKPYQYVAIRADITDRKNAEEKIQQSEKIYRTIASSIPGSMICLLDEDYRYLLIEGDMLEKLGYSKEKLLGNKAVDVITPARYAEVLPDFQRVFCGEAFIYDSQRGDYHILTRFVPLKDETGNVYAAMVVIIDITELKKAEKKLVELNASLEQKVNERTGQLETVNKELEAFTYSVSHDLRAPLRAINGYSQMLEKKCNNVLDEEGERLLEVIKNNAKKMGILIDNLLDFSRLGRKEIQRSFIDMNILVDNAISEINQANTHCAVIKKEDLHPIMGDNGLMSHVMINLVSNAIKYSAKKEDPHILITSKKENNEIIFSVQDNGAGFEMEYAHKLFGVFQRLHSAKEFAGTGVGLAIVQRIINKHGGKVWAKGKPGEGAIFYFSIPELKL